MCVVLRSSSVSWSATDVIQTAGSWCARCDSTYNCSDSSQYKGLTEGCELLLILALECYAIYYYFLEYGRSSCAVLHERRW
jgi:hypothetical protein